MFNNRIIAKVTRERIPTQKLVLSAESRASNGIKPECQTHIISHFQNDKVGKGEPPEYRGGDPSEVWEGDPEVMEGEPA